MHALCERKFFELPCMFQIQDIFRMMQSKDRSKSKYHKTRRIKQRLLRSKHTVINGSTIVVALLLLACFGLTQGQEEWREGFADDGTTHEALGTQHFPPAELTPYKPNVKYTAEKPKSNWHMGPVFRFTHTLIDKIMTNNPRIPDGYIAVKNGDTLAYGPKVDRNDWSDLLAAYWVLIIWCLFLLIIVIVIPFIAVCYCCFCCCRRCPVGCPPCDKSKAKKKSCICSVILLILLIFVLLGVIIAFATSRMFDRGLDGTSETLKRGGTDTCRFLKDVGDHVNHMFVYNYQELKAHLEGLVNEAHNHIFLDLGDTSGANAVDELERTLDNMHEARKLFSQVQTMELDLRYLSSQLRDGVRGVKRDINYACATLISHDHCKKMLLNTGVEYLDTSPCLHLDKLPDTAVYIKGVDDVISKKLEGVPKKAIQRIQEIGQKIEASMEQVTPAIIKDITNGNEKFSAHATNIKNVIDAVISEIHLKTVRSTTSFEDVYTRFGSDRSLTATIACAIIFLISLVLLISLICGVCGKKATGANCLLAAIILIFCTLSFLFLMGLFYFIAGIVAYQGACAPLRDQENNEIFRKLDSVINLQRIAPDTGTSSSNQNPLRMSKALRACKKNETIFNLLSSQGIYNTDTLRETVVIRESEEDDKKAKIFDEDLSKVVLLTPDEAISIGDLRNNNLTSYHSIMYLQHMCKALTPNLVSVAAQIRSVRDNIAVDKDWELYNKYGRYSLSNEAYHLDIYNTEWTDKIHSLQDRMKEKLQKIDRLILYENRNFNDSLRVLLEAAKKAEIFLRTRGSDYINKIGSNLTDVVKDQISEYIETLITQSNRDVGHCQPLAYIYYRGIDLICYRLVDPLNGFWFGILLSAFFLIPILFVTHRLMCLWKALHLYKLADPEVLPPPVQGECPTCTGAPFVPPPIVTCGGGQQTFCVCTESKRKDGGGLFTSLENNSPNIASATSENNQEDQRQSNVRYIHDQQQQQLLSQPKMEKGITSGNNPSFSSSKPKED